MIEGELWRRALFSLLLLLGMASATLFLGVVSDTGSMRPTYKGGEEVLLKPAQSAEIGDIIVFSNGSRLIMHRVIFKFEGCYITKGDAVLFPDWGCAEPEYLVLS